MERLLKGWRYAPVPDSERPESSSHREGHSTLQYARECVNSKAFWRIVLVLASILLLANLFRPASDELAKYGWISSDSSIAIGNPDLEGVDWSQYAYCQYVTNEEYLCNSLMIFESLVRVKARAQRLMMYPEEWNIDDSNHGRLLAKARDEYGVHLVPIHVERLAGEATWAESFTKLLAFNQTQYKRVLSLDSDATVLKPMDELFLLPSAPVGMPRAYWLDQPFLSSQLVLIEPSKFEFERIEAAFSTRANSDFDMEIVNDLYGTSCFIIPHRKYDLLTGEFRAAADQHYKYLGSKEEAWNPKAVFDEAKFLHFSDWPYPKPWIAAGEAATAQSKPECRVENGVADCEDQKIWLGIYEDYRKRRADVCSQHVGRREKRSEVVDASPKSAYGPVFALR